MSEIARLSHEDRLLTVHQSHGETGPRLILVQEDDPARQSVVLTTYEVRWLAELWRPTDAAAESAVEAVVEAAKAWAADSTPETRLRLHAAVAMLQRDSAGAVDAVSDLARIPQGALSRPRSRSWWVRVCRWLGVRYW